MLKTISDLPDGVVGMRAVGTFTIDDYTSVVEPEVDRLEAEHTKLRLVLHLGKEFTGFGEGAWGDLTNELRHVHFHRGAVVTDDHHIRNGLNVLKWALKGDVRTFRDDEYDRAVSWAAG